MGKPTGFLEIPRQSAPIRPAKERLKDYKEIFTNPPVEHLASQASRCMDCGVPFCQSEPGCPVDNLVPEWNDLVYKGQWREALDRLHRTNPFPDFTGRVCPAPCEGACVLGIDASPVTIKNIEYAIAERGFAENWIQARQPTSRTGKKIAIIGSGPAGLAAATRLNQFGHTVSVYERDDRIGGLLMYGIPPMKLDKEIVNRRVQIMEKEGVQFHPGSNVGGNLDIQELNEKSDALLLACGSTRPRDLKIEGRHFKGIHFAMDFLRTTTKSYLDSNLRNGNYISAENKKVIVIGGGDTGTDCIATALRQNCRSLINFELLPVPPRQRNSEENPWPQWPHILRQDYGHQEAEAKFGNDPRQFQISSKRFLDDGNGNLVGIQTVQVEPDGAGNFRESPGSEREWPCDMVLLAMGFLGPEDTITPKLPIQLDDHSNFQADFGAYSTSQEGIFAAGDCRRGQSLVVWAIREGWDAAVQINKYVSS
jgi:NAD(P)H-dependent glutamate synthase small subunit